MQAIAMGNTHPDVVSTALSRLSRVSKSLTPNQHNALMDIANISLHELCTNISKVIDVDYIYDEAVKQYNTPEPTPEQIETVRKEQTKQALKPLYNPKYRDAIINFKKDNEQVIDIVSLDSVLFSGFSDDAKEKAKSLIDDFTTFLEENKEELELIKAYYSHSYKEKVKFSDLKKFTATLSTQPKLRVIENLWQAISVLHPEKVIETDDLTQTDYISLLSFV